MEIVILDGDFIFDVGIGVGRYGVAGDEDVSDVLVEVWGVKLNVVGLDLGVRIVTGFSLGAGISRRTVVGVMVDLSLALSGCSDSQAVNGLRDSTTIASSASSSPDSSVSKGWNIERGEEVCFDKGPLFLFLEVGVWTMKDSAVVDVLARFDGVGGTNSSSASSNVTFRVLGLSCLDRILRTLATFMESSRTLGFFADDLVRGSAAATAASLSCSILIKRSFMQVQFLMIDFMVAIQSFCDILKVLHNACSFGSCSCKKLVAKRQKGLHYSHRVRGTAPNRKWRTAQQWSSRRCSSYSGCS